MGGKVKLLVLKSLTSSRLKNKKNEKRISARTAGNVK